MAIDLTGILPTRLASASRKEVLKAPIRADERPCELGDLFHASGSATDRVIEGHGDFSRVHAVAAGLDGGRFVIRGNAGRHAGEGMTGGRLEIMGDAGDWLAAEMTGGRVHVAGGAGDNAAGALPGSDAGLRGGLVTITGNVGCLAGARLRRGLLAIGGGCGEAAGFELRSGLIVVGGRAGPSPGLGMRRGSLIFLADRPRPPAGFSRGVAWTPPFIPLLFRRLSRAGMPPPGPPPGRWRQWHGDLLEGGRGELLHAEFDS